MLAMAVGFVGSSETWAWLTPPPKTAAAPIAAASPNILRIACLRQNRPEARARYGADCNRAMARRAERETPPASRPTAPFARSLDVAGQAIAAKVLRRPRTAAPTPPKPRIIRAQLAGSGTPPPSTVIEPSR